MAFDDSFPKLDLSYTMNMASGVQRQIEESNRRSREISNEAYETRQRMQNALEQTASNTAETNLQLQKVVENQLKNTQAMCQPPALVLMIPRDVTSLYRGSIRISKGTHIVAITRKNKNP